MMVVRSSGLPRREFLHIVGKTVLVGALPISLRVGQEATVSRDSKEYTDALKELNKFKLLDKDVIESAAYVVALAKRKNQTGLIDVVKNRLAALEESGKKTGRFTDQRVTIGTSTLSFDTPFSAGTGIDFITTETGKTNNMTPIDNSQKFSASVGNEIRLYNFWATVTELHPPTADGTDITLLITKLDNTTETVVLHRYSYRF